MTIKLVVNNTAKLKKKEEKTSTNRDDIPLSEQVLTRWKNISKLRKLNHPIESLAPISSTIIKDIINDLDNRDDKSPYEF